MASHYSFPLFLTLSLVCAIAATRTKSLPAPSLLNACEALANSGHIAMSLTLQLISPDLPLPSPSAVTIFSPPDSAFFADGQPSLARLLLQFSPVSASPASLHSLPFASTLPSLSHSRHLTITSNSIEENAIISINNVEISRSPIFDDGFVIVYAVDSFFDLNFTLDTPVVTNSSKVTDYRCMKLESVSRYRDAAGELESRGYSIMASFLDLQIIGFLGNENTSHWTVFAPIDEDLMEYSGSFLEYPSIFMRHVVPCKVGWSELGDMANGTLISTVKGFSLEITKDKEDETFMVNGLEITFPDMYDSEWLVIHGIRGMINALPGEETESSITLDRNEVEFSLNQ